MASAKADLTYFNINLILLLVIKDIIIASQVKLKIVNKSEIY